MPLSSVLNAGQTINVKSSKKRIELPDDGGIITLLESKGPKVHGVSYTGKDASEEGWTIVFENLKSSIGEAILLPDLLLPAPFNQLFIPREQPLLILG